MRRFVPGALGLLFISALFSAYSAYQSMRRKIESIESDQLRPGSRVTISQRELNAYVQQEVSAAVPEGVREPKLELGDGAAKATALIDFLKVRRAQGNPPGWLMSKLLDGERPVQVYARVTSGKGRAQVDVQSVQISGVNIDGKMLDFLIQHYLVPNYPAAKVGQPFELGHRIERLDVKPSEVGVVIGK
jgi:hypothetical protein